MTTERHRFDIIDQEQMAAQLVAVMDAHLQRPSADEKYHILSLARGQIESERMRVAASTSRPVHQTESVQVWADVDVGIAAFVRHLNTIPGVRTHACCQGTMGEGGAESYRAYVGVSWWTDDAKNALEHFGLSVEGECHGTVHPME